MNNLCKVLRLLRETFQKTTAGHCPNFIGKLFEDFSEETHKFSQISENWKVYLSEENVGGDGSPELAVSV